MYLSTLALILIWNAEPETHLTNHLSDIQLLWEKKKKTCIWKQALTRSLCSQKAPLTAQSAAI